MTPVRGQVNITLAPRGPVRNTERSKSSRQERAIWRVGGRDGEIRNAGRETEKSSSRTLEQGSETGGRSTGRVRRRKLETLARGAAGNAQKGNRRLATAQAEADEGSHKAVRKGHLGHFSCGAGAESTGPTPSFRLSCPVPSHRGILGSALDYS